MKRHVLRLSLLLALCLPLIAPAAAFAGFDEGIDYKKIEPPMPTTAPAGKIQVTEMFWYGCPHCFHFEPKLLNWLKTKPKDVDFVRIPAVFPGRESWEVHARAFYTAQVLGILSKTHEALFNAIHVDGRPENSEQNLQAFFAKHGVQPQVFKETFNSFAVYTKVRKAADLTRRSKITGVPSMIVAGKYRVDGDLAGGQERMLKVVNFLIKREREARSAGAGH